LDLSAVQEVKWDRSGSLKTQEMAIIYSGGEKHERGVGLVIYTLVKYKRRKKHEGKQCDL